MFRDREVQREKWQVSTLEFKQGGPRLTEEDLLAAEQGLAVRLPPKYRAFLKRQNGGSPERCAMAIPDHWDGTDLLECFWGIHCQHSVHDLLLRRCDFPEYASRGLLIIGNTASGCLVCVDLSREGAEPIVYLDVSESSDPMRRRAYWLAEDIDQFCASLQA